MPSPRLFFFSDLLSLPSLSPFSLSLFLSTVFALALVLAHRAHKNTLRVPTAPSRPLPLARSSSSMLASLSLFFVPAGRGASHRASRGRGCLPARLAVAPTRAAQASPGKKKKQRKKNRGCGCPGRPSSFSLSFSLSFPLRGETRRTCASALALPLFCQKDRPPSGIAALGPAAGKCLQEWRLLPALLLHALLGLACRPRETRVDV